MNKKKVKAVFLDRDGTLNKMVYNEAHGLLDSPMRPSQVRAIPGAAELIKGLKKRGWLVIVVTNQPGIAKGTLTHKRLGRINGQLAEALARKGARWDDLRYCPHHPKGGPGGDPASIRKCNCRKPKPGLLTGAARDWNVDLKKSWMVGDGLNDLSAGRAAGCRTILVTKLKLEQIERFLDMDGRGPDAIASDLKDVLKIIR